MVSGRVRRRVLKRDSQGGQAQRVCPLCGEAKPELEFDHKQPRSRGGRSTAANLWLICKTCNRRKRDKTLYELRSNKE